ncbi:hypothetical protein [Microbacterium testaceum]|uniref:Glycosyltransferase n=1 Tax=Microbacterium testaceum TaxID=2033 RepID=A0A147F6E2_MICTE|nr:hypothetical protein [Microbacterium testaceum]KTS11080.1 hypothetical protein RSA3_11130 [Microbacterium testaceum]
MPAPSRAPVLHVILRTTPSENRKNRPAWYSKNRCIASMFTAAEHARATGLDVRVTVAVDVSSGLAYPGSISRLLRRADSFLVVRGGTAAKSWRPVIRAVRSSIRPDDDDLVYFVEDDHLHRPEALRLLVEGSADYRLLYALASEHGTITPLRPGWAHVPGGTSSFAVTGRALRADASRHLWMSCGGGAWDELSWRALGSHVSKPGLAYVLAPFHPTPKWPRPWGLRPLRHAAFRLLCLLLARGRQRSIELRLPIQVTHCEKGMLAGEDDWARVALSMDTQPDAEHAPVHVPDAATIIPPRTRRRDVRALLAALG